MTHVKAILFTAVVTILAVAVGNRIGFIRSVMSTDIIPG